MGIIGGIKTDRAASSGANGNATENIATNPNMITCTHMCIQPCVLEAWVVWWTVECTKLNWLR